VETGFRASARATAGRHCVRDSPPCHRAPFFKRRFSLVFNHLRINLKLFERSGVIEVCIALEIRF
jgi:hypothetical protein